eukprot:g8821.t1.1.5e17418a g8821  g8821.t1 contig34:180830-181448(-)
MASSGAPSWANTSRPARPPPIEDHLGTTTSSSNTSGMDELLAPVSTLDEPVMETIMRDVRAVGGKLKAVLLPLDRNKPFGYVGVLQEESVEPSDGQRNVLNQLKDWDLWYVAFLVVGVCLSLLKLNLYSPSPLHLPPIFAWNNSTIHIQHTKQSTTASTQSQTTITGDHSSSVSL